MIGHFFALMVRFTGTVVSSSNTTCFQWIPFVHTMAYGYVVNYSLIFSLLVTYSSFVRYSFFRSGRSTYRSPRGRVSSFHGRGRGAISDSYQSSSRDSYSTKPRFRGYAQNTSYRGRNDNCDLRGRGTYRCNGNLIYIKCYPLSMMLKREYSRNVWEFLRKC